MTSTVSEIKLTNVARASLEEVLEDSAISSAKRDRPIWDKDSKGRDTSASNWRGALANPTTPTARS